MISQSPSPRREDLRYGDPHGNRGKHVFYGPDLYDINASDPSKPNMESHGFYMAQEKKSHSLWERIKEYFVGERLP